jgi:hypothetical protein
MKRDIKQLLRWARGRGWTASPTGRGHWCLRHPRNGIVYMSGTPSDWRALHNAKARLLRHERNQENQTRTVLK